MYENWIKFEKLTLEKPEVYQMAAKLKLDNHGVVGRLLIVWSWFDDHTEDGTAPESVIPMLDSKTCKGFIQAMKDVRWLSIEGGQVSITNYEKHNGASSKKRASAASRKAKHRAKTEYFCHSKSVTSAGHLSHQKRDKVVTWVGRWRDIAVTEMGLARSSQFSFSFFTKEGKYYLRSILGGQVKFRPGEVCYAA